MGNMLGVAAENGRAGAHVARVEFAALALFDVLGGGELTEAQAYQLERWRGQRGGRP
jgi:hypothetical protein